MVSIRKKLVLGAASLALPATLIIAGLPAGAATVKAATSAATKTAKLTVFHGIPGVDVNVYVNGKLTLTDFKPAAFAGPLSLPAGGYKIDITSYAADMAAGMKSADVIGPVTVKLHGGHNYTVAAYLTTAGKPTAALFDNNITKLASKKGRVTVVHLADAPTVKITANGATLIKSLSNGKRAGAVVPAKTYKVGIVAGGKTVFSTKLPVAAGTNTIVYAYGTYPKTFAVAVQKIKGLAKK
jgi:hypothetical protein